MAKQKPTTSAEAQREPASAPVAAARASGAPAHLMVRATKRSGGYRNSQVRVGWTFKLEKAEDYNPTWMEPAEATDPDMLAPAGTGHIKAPGGAPERPRPAAKGDKGDDEREVI